MAFRGHGAHPCLGSSMSGGLTSAKSCAGCGILFVLYTGIRWEFLPQELGFGSGMTCWRRLQDWNEAGVWQKLHELLLAELRAGSVLDLTRASVDGSHLRAMKGGDATGRARRWTAAGRAANATSSSTPTASRSRPPQRRHLAPAPDPGCAADPRQARSAPSAPRRALRRPRLRSRHLPP